MKTPPKGWPRISSSLFYQDPAKAIDWLCRAFGFSVRLRVEGEAGRIEHSELEYGEGLIMVGGAGEDYVRADKAWRARTTSPQMAEGKTTQALCVHVEDVDAHYARAKAAGAEIVYEPTNTDYGDDYWEDRSYGALDPEGHLWWFMQRIREPQTHAE